MKLIFTKPFKRDYRKLPSNTQERMNKQLKFLLEDLQYPSLNAKKIQGHPNIWEAKVTESYRFTFQIEGDYYLLRRIGTHDILKKP